MRWLSQPAVYLLKKSNFLGPAYAGQKPIDEYLQFLLLAPAAYAHQAGW